ncbi:MAG: small multi-drug export protein [Caldisericia bacterium]|nr:small multi-drug export protein [Caldisericia bacterium]MDD4614590.1 small multi-drug export protein [Caldisericia bacterium]
MNLLYVFILAMTPIGELRLSIPSGIGAGLGWEMVFLVSLVGNFIPAIILIYTLPLLEPLRHRTDFFLWEWFDKALVYAERKQDLVHAYGWIGLLLLVAIPLPGTGAYTGSIVSFLLRMHKNTSLFFILLGLFIAGVIVTLASKGIIHFLV